MNKREAAKMFNDIVLVMGVKSFDKVMGEINQLYLWFDEVEEGG